jgi:hypothetical protein
MGTPHHYFPNHFSTSTLPHGGAQRTLIWKNIMDEISNVIQFPIRPPPATHELQPHPRDSSVYVREDSSAFIVNGEECAKLGDFTFVHVRANGEAMQFDQFDTIEEATHAGRAYADAFNIVFQS